MAEQTNRFVRKAAVATQSPDAADALLSYLRTVRGDAALSYASAPVAITGGFDTSISAFELRGARDEWSGPLILRVYRDGGQEQARFEAVAQNAVAAQGYPAPKMLHTCEDASILGGAFAIMRRVAGVTMIDRLLSPSLFRIPVLLAQSHAQLHALDVEPVRDAMAAAGFAITDRSAANDIDDSRGVVEAAQLDGLREAHVWLAANLPGDRRKAVCHGDLHPLNVMMESNAVSGVLDWSSMRIEDPMWDVGATVAIMSQGPVELPAPVRPLVGIIRRRILARYLKVYGGEQPLDTDALRYFEAMRLFGFLLEVGIYRQSRAGVLPPSTKPTAFDDPAILASIAQRFGEISGVEPSLLADVA